jgi:hypothetical protein
MTFQFRELDSKSIVYEIVNFDKVENNFEGKRHI